jgi:(p)ppGpp synthase/HD superfamily hydrolase
VNDDEKKKRRDAWFAKWGDEEIPACKFCGRCVLAGICCQAALDALRTPPARPALARAEGFAADAHGDQKYGKDLPYTYHLRQVVGVLQRFGVADEDILVAAWLHDTVEDTDVEPWHIDLEFGQNVSDLVWAVTNEPGKNRAERHKNTYPKIARIPGATLLKLADRIANVEQCLGELRRSGESKLLAMYQKEQEHFEAALRTGEGDTEERMWKWLRNLLWGPLADIQPA